MSQVAVLGSTESEVVFALDPQLSYGDHFSFEVSALCRVLRVTLL